MASKTKQLHFIMIPLMAQGHMIPMIDFASMLAQRNVLVTIVTTPLNAIRFKSVITRAVESGLQIRIVKLHFPCVEVGLPEGCENFDALASHAEGEKLFSAAKMLQEQVEKLLERMEPPPTCLIADVWMPWAANVAHKFHIPRIAFQAMSCFAVLCLHNVTESKVLDDIPSELDRFVVPGVPGQIEMTKSEFPKQWQSSEVNDFFRDIKKAEEEADGVVVNTFKELEAEYVKEYEKVKGNKVWCVGPVSLCNKNHLDKAERGKKASIDEIHCLKWLDSWESNSVVYVCLGSLSKLSTSQMMELGLGLEASNRPFIWVIGYKSDDLERWMIEDGFEERTKGKGLLICGWAPQVLILSHRAIGGFLTHCGWNSTIEAMCAGVPMLAWPVFADQFINEKLIVNVLKIGVMIGVKVPVLPGEEEKTDVLVKKNDIKNGVDRLMDDGREGEDRRKRVRKLGELAKKAVEDGGSSEVYMTQLIKDIAK